MPLEPGSSREAVSRNIETERNAGKKESQAVAIAMSEARKSQSDGSPIQDDSVLPVKITAAEINEQNRRYWYQQEFVGPNVDPGKSPNE
jgi:hypothetical protein